MNQFFHPDSPIMRFITKIVLSVYLNILWFVCCIPIVTIGASTTALFYTCQKLVRDEEGHVTQDFFHSFRQNLKQGCLIGILFLFLGMILGIDGYVLYHKHFTNAFWTIITAIYFVAVIAYGIVLMYVFPLLARFHNTTHQLLLNSIMIGMRFLICTALMAAVYFAMALIVIAIFTPAIIFGMGTCALICSYLMKGILTQLEANMHSDPDIHTPDHKGGVA